MPYASESYVSRYHARVHPHPAPAVLTARELVSLILLRATLERDGAGTEYVSAALELLDGDA